MSTLLFDQPLLYFSPHTHTQLLHERTQRVLLSTIHHVLGFLWITYELAHQLSPYFPMLYDFWADELGPFC